MERFTHQWIAAILFSLVLAVPASSAEQRSWSTSTGTAYTLPKGHWQKGLFDYLRYGQTDRLEWATHPVLDLVVPNLKVKVAHRQVHNWDLATQYNFHYPTLLLRLLRREGIGGLIAPDPDIPEIPHIFSLRSEVLATRMLNPSLWLTGKGGISVALKTAGDLDERTTIDIPVVFTRMATYYHGFQLNFGLGLDGDLSGRWAFSADTDIFLIPGQDESFAFELRGWLSWSKSSRFRILFGYMLTYTVFPFGSQWQIMPYPVAFGPGARKLVFPMIDLQWAGQRKVKR
ncbi:MAG: hypothetical protein JSW54_10875 [Fidelibacterota bacterium]|nr:MAG: hypothetical protein JSW54_10875 [Candidatus Neomarinimicrobiota bacterium]